MMKRFATALALAMAALSTSAMAQPAPILEAADPDTFQPAGYSPGPTINLTLYGENIPPDWGNHPDFREYWHVFVRSVSPDGTAGAWSHCDDSDGCGLVGFNSAEMIMNVNLRRWASTNNSTFQMHYYTGLDDPGATDPAVNKYHQPLSNWSNIWSWKVAAVRAEAPPAPHPIVLRARALAVIPVAPPPKAVMRVRPGMVQLPLAPRPLATPAPLAAPAQLPH